MKILISENGKRFLFRDQDVHTQFGFITKNAIDNSKDGDTLISNTNHKFSVFPAQFIDLYRRIKRGPQIIPLKDLAAIISETAINKDSIVIESGTGSGSSACFFANIAKHVYTYEQRVEFLEIAKKNAEFLSLPNITFHEKNVMDGIEEKDADLILLDLPNPWDAAEIALNSLKVGGFLVSYSPTTPQISDFSEKLSKIPQLRIIKITEIFERDWEAKERKVRPKSQSIGHSGFLVFARKISA